MKKAIEILEARLAWMMENPTAPIYPTGPTREAYCNGFIRKSGSYVEGITSMDQVKELFEQMMLVELGPDEVGDCYAEGHHYYKAELPMGYTAYSNVIELNDLTDEQLAEVKFIRGEHGIEVQLEAGDFKNGTAEISFIADGDGLVTWYPGTFTMDIRLHAATVKLI